MSSDGSTGVFEVTDQLNPLDHHTAELHPKTVPLDRLQQLWRDFLAGLPEQRQKDVDGSFVLLLSSLGHTDEARAYARRTAWTHQDFKRIRGLHERILASEPKKAKKYGLLLQEVEESLKRARGSATT